MDEVCLLKNNCTGTVYCSLLLRMAKMDMDCIFRIFKVLVPIFKAKHKMYYGLLLRKVLIDVLVLNLKAMSSARLRVRKKDF